MRPRVIALIALCTLVASPLLACLPNSSMTPAEMECCKKMAGNCDMGGGNHKCCDTTVNRSAPTAVMAQSSTASDVALPTATGTPLLEPLEVHASDYFGLTLASVSPSPPGFSLSLRI